MNHAENESQEFGQFLLTYLPLSINNIICENLRESGDQGVLKRACEHLKESRDKFLAATQTKMVVLPHIFGLKNDMINGFENHYEKLVSQRDKVISDDEAEVQRKLDAEQKLKDRIQRAIEMLQDEVK